MFRFTIRDLLWLMVVVGILATWCVDHRRMAIGMRLAWAIVMNDGKHSVPMTVERRKKYMKLMDGYRAELQLPLPAEAAELYQP